jgi:hypothetical protein
MHSRRILRLETLAALAAVLLAVPVAAQSDADSTSVPTASAQALAAPPGLVAATLEAFEWSEDDHHGGLRLTPREFVGAIGDCGKGYPAGARIVQAAWLTGMGLPDRGQPNSNPDDPRDNPAKRDPHYGLLLSKNGPTPDCSAAGARVRGTRHSFTIEELGLDFRNGTACGAGAPRVNVYTEGGLVYFIGCSAGTRTPAPQDPAQWTRVRFSEEDVFPQMPDSPPFEFGVTEVERLTIVFDEGTDTAHPDQPSGTGLVVIDNFVLNGRTVTRP